MRVVHLSMRAAIEVRGTVRLKCFFLFGLIVVVYLGHGIFNPVAVCFFSKSVVLGIKDMP